MSDISKTKEREPMFSAKVLKLLKNPFNLENPITVQVLGICSALAVTVQMKPAIVMALSVTIVTAFSNLIISSFCAIPSLHVSGLLFNWSLSPHW